jgi:hypothetical protein
MGRAPAGHSLASIPNLETLRSLASAVALHQRARERPLRTDELAAVRLEPTAGRARAPELLALSNNALDQHAELVDHHILVRLGVHLRGYAASRSSA